MQEIRASIFEPVITQLVAEGRELYATVVRSERDAAVQRMLMGRFLLKAREQLPRRARNANEGWMAFLEAIEMSHDTATRYIALAEATLTLNVRNKDDVALIPNYEQLGLNRREGAQQPDAPPPGDGDAPVELLDQGEPQNENEAKEEDEEGSRDEWCTNEEVAAALPKKLDTDPCSNPRSIVRAARQYMLEHDQNGLELPWIGLTYVNGPYSELMPWAEKLAAELAKPRKERTLKGAGFLVNVDSSPKWWHLLTEHLHIRLDFNARLQFIPPEGIKASKNDRSQTLLMTPEFWKACDRRAFLAIGTLWIKQSK